MLTNNDLTVLLMQLEKENVEGASAMLKRTLGKRGVDFEALSFINKVRPLEVTNFYEHIRKNYNNKRSDLYKNIVRGEWDADTALSTLHAFALQVFLFSKHIDEKNRTMFYKHARAEEVSRVLHDYYSTYDLDSALKMLSLLKADIVAFESSIGRRWNL